MAINLEPLEALDKVFKKFNITYWLDCGTLLGAVREGKPMDWDSDIDISIWFKDLPKVYMRRKEFLKYGYEFRCLPKPGICKGKDHRICIVALKVRKGKLVQMFGWNWVTKISYYVNRHMNYGFTYHIFFLLSMLFGAKRLKWGEYEWLGNLAYVEMLGTVYPIPEHVEEYLAYRYGADWRTPIRGIPWLKVEQGLNASRWHGFDEKYYVFKDDEE